MKFTNSVNSSSLKIDIKLTKTFEKLYMKAKKIKENAYSPYSNYKVGAAVLLKNGKIFTGCNVENASYGLTMCAERSAIFNAVSSGYKKDDFVAIAISASSDNFSPCGACRQVIAEFGKDILVIFEYEEKIIIESSLGLLPHSFSLS